MPRDSIDILIERLYSSNDPLCYDAAYSLDQAQKKREYLERKVSEISLAAKYMLESLMEINALSSERDDRTHKDYKDLSRELNLRLFECGNISKDTIDLKSVKRAYERMYYE